ncbi:MAG: methyl-accepting chemotaxis protein, partial [Thioalkalispiraceae bacterium]
MARVFKFDFVDDFFRSKIGRLPIRRKLTVGFGTILSFMAVIVVVAVIGLFLVLNNINLVVKDHQPTVFASAKLGQYIKDASGSLGLYLLGKEELHKKNYKHALTKIESTLDELSKQETIQDDADSLLFVQAIKKDIENLKRYESKFFELASSDIANFPGILYASENLNPISRDILNNINNMLLTEQDEPASEARRKLLFAIGGLRYGWTSVMNSVRAYLADRSDRSVQNIKLFQEKSQLDIDRINKLSKQQESELRFDQADAFEQIIALREKFFQNIENLYKIHSSNEWRQDASLMRTEVGPILRDIDVNLNQLENRAQQKIDDANSYLMAEVIVIIIIALLMLLAAFIAARRISGQIIKGIVTPLNEVVDATGKIAAGDLTVTLDETTDDEIGQLISSLNMMAVNLAALVSSVKKSGIQVTSSSTEIAATAKQQEATVTEQAATANQISTTATEISATVQGLVKTMDEVTGVTETTANAAADSQSALASMEQTMHHMMDATASIGSKLSVL